MPEKNRVLSVIQRAKDELASRGYGKPYTDEAIRTQAMLRRGYDPTDPEDQKRYDAERKSKRNTEETQQMIIDADTQQERRMMENYLEFALRKEERE